MSMIIGLAGRAGSGKSTCANFLESKGFKKDAYAKIMKEAVAVMFGVPLSTLLGDITVKSQVDPYWDMTYRHMLQQFGTEACRKTFGGDVWEKALWRQYTYPLMRPAEGLVIEDVRFPNEAEAIRHRGGFVIEIVRPSTITKKKWWQREHASERPLPRRLIDLQVYNKFDVGYMLRQVDSILENRV